MPTFDQSITTRLTTDGDILTRTAGAPARLTRAALAADAAFAGKYVSLATGIDMTGATDMTATVNDQMSALSTAGGGRYRLPVGTVLGMLFSIPSNVILEGSGPGTVLKLKASATDHLVRGGGTNGGINNLTLDGNDANQGANSRNALCPTLAVGFQIGTIWVKNTTGDACLLAGCTDTTIGQIIGTGIGRNGFSTEDSGGTQTTGVVAGLIIAHHAAPGTPNAGIDIERGSDIAIGTAIVEGFPYNAVIIGYSGPMKNITIGTLIGKGAGATKFGVLIDGTAQTIDNVEIGSAVFDNPAASGDYSIGPGTTRIRVSKPGALEIVRPTFPVELAVTAVSVRAANYTHYYRVVEGGTISKIRLHVQTQSGNICVAAYHTADNGGRGLSAKPRFRLATSGSVACPAAGSADVSLGSSVTLVPGDWIAIAADNVTAKFYGFTGLGGLALVDGQTLGQAATFPCIDNPPGTAGLVSDSLALIGMVGVT